MTEIDDKADDKATRRAQRREQQQNANPGAEGTPGASRDSDGPVSGGSDAGLELFGDTEDAQPKRVEQIRDRNARLRAQAAEERRAKRDREKATVAVPMGLDASERMDDIFVRSTHAAAGWLKSNFRWLQWVAIGAVVLGFGVQGYRYSSKSKAAKSTDALAIGLTAEGGSIRLAADDESKSVNPELEQLDPRPVYDSESSRMTAAEQGYRKAIATYGTSGAGWLARIGLAGVLYDQQKWDEALELYRGVRNAEVAKKDPDLLGRAIEGIGLTLEGKGDREGALQAFRELTNQEGSASLATLGLYHQARILLEQGNREKAKELAVKAKERLDKDSQAASGKDKEIEAPPKRPGFVGESIKMLMARIDPSSAGPGGGTRNIADVLRDNPDRLQKMLEGLKDQQGPANAPAAPAPGENP